MTTYPTPMAALSAREANSEFVALHYRRRIRSLAPLFKTGRGVTKSGPCEINDMGMYLIALALRAMRKEIT